VQVSFGYQSARELIKEDVGVTEGLKAVPQGDVAQPAAGASTTERKDSVGSADPLLLLPESLVRGLRSRRAAWSKADTIATWLITAHLLLLWVIVSRGSFYVDDLRAQGYTLHQPFLDFVMGSNGTHFAPIPRTLDWLQAHYLPLQHGPAVAVTLLVRLLLAVGFWRVLRRQFGPRLTTLIPLTILLLTPALIPATTYYRQSITILACTAAIVWALDAHLRWMLYRHRADLVILFVVTAIGLGCYEKAAAIPVLLLAATLTIFVGGNSGDDDRQPGQGEDQPSHPRPLSQARAGFLGVLVSAAVVLIFWVIYRSGPYDQGPESLPSSFDVLHLAGDTVTKTVIPLLLGGPFHWSYAFGVPYAGTPDLSGTTVAFSLLIVLVGLAAALWRSPDRTGRALALLIAWVVPSVAIVAAGRFQSLGLGLATTTRLWADLVPGFLLAGALAALPWRVGVHARTAPGKAASTAPEQATSDSDPIEVTVPALACGLVLILVLGGSVFSTLTYTSKWWDNPTGQWISNARLSLSAAELYPRTLATPLPESVMPGWIAWTFPSDAPLLELLRPDVRFHDADADAKMMNPFGLRSGYVPNILAQTKPAKLCVTKLPAGEAPITVTLPTAPAYVPGAQIDIGLLITQPTKIEVLATTPSGAVVAPERYSNDELVPGPHNLRLPMPYLQAVKSVTLRAHTTTENCITYVRIWAPAS
jgi:hypothetical protein